MFSSIASASSRALRRPSAAAGLKRGFATKAAGVTSSSSTSHAKTAASLVAGAAGLATLWSLSHGDKSTGVAFADKVGSMVFTWGSGQYGQLGLGGEDDANLPTELSYTSEQGLEPVNMSCGGAHTLLVMNDGGVYVCGREMGGWTNNQHVPMRVALPAGAKAVTGAISDVHGAVVDTQGRLYTWGNNWNGQLGRGAVSEDEANDAGQVVVPGDDSVRFVSVSCGPQHTAATDTKGRVYTWGYGRSHQLGLDTRDQFNTPQLVGGIEGKALKICCGHDSTAVLCEDGSVWTMGADDYGQLGHGAGERYQRVPRKVQTLSASKVVDISVGEYHVLAATDEGHVYAWGQGAEGQLGQGNREEMFLPKTIAALSDVKITSVSCGGGHSLCLSNNGKLYAFGRGRNGQLGRADKLESVAAYRTLPLEVEFFHTEKLLVTKMACGIDHTAVMAAR